MNLIEKSGGYEKAKSKLRDNGSLHSERLKKALIEYRRQHNIFEVGDKVVFEAHFCDEHKGSGYGEITYCTMDKRVFEIDSYYLVSIDEIRHATLDEIRAGHRIDANTDYVSDIRNHISPMTIVQGDL